MRGLGELRRWAYSDAVGWQEFMDVWLPMLLLAKKDLKVLEYEGFGYLCSYYINIEYCDVWLTVCDPR